MRVAPLESVIPATINPVITLQGTSRHLHAARQVPDMHDASSRYGAAVDN